MNYLKSIWEYTLFDLQLGNFITAIGIFLLFIIFRWCLAKILSRYIAKSPKTFSAKMMSAVKGPLLFIPIGLGVIFAMLYLYPSGVMHAVGIKIATSFLLFILFWALYTVLPPLAERLMSAKAKFSQVMVEFLLKTAELLVVFFGVAMILEVWGIQVAPLLAGLGIFGIAVALGGQDLVKNLISGILIVAEKRFNKGEWILVEGVVEGIVEQLGFRSTLVRRFDRAPVFVPNAKLADTAVVNFSKMSHRRIYWHIGLEYKTSVEQLRSITEKIKAYLVEADGFARPDEMITQVRVDKFSESSIDLILYCFTKTIVWVEFLQIKENLALKIKEIVESEGASFAFPSRSLYLQDPPELFTPPKADK